MPGDEKINVMMASLGMDDMNIPELKINQATGGDYAKESLKANLGQMYVSTTGDIFDQVDVQVLMVQKNRTFWGRTDITDDPPICSSLDGVTSVDGQICKACQHFRERASMDKEERRRECQTGYVVMALDENQMPLVIRLMGISADAGRDLNAMLYFNKALRTNRGAFYFRVSTMKKKTAAGEAWMFKFLIQKEKFPSNDFQLEYARVAKDLGLLAAPAAPEQITQGEAESQEAAFNNMPSAGDDKRQADLLKAADKAIADSKTGVEPTPIEEKEIPDIKF